MFNKMTSKQLAHPIGYAHVNPIFQYRTQHAATGPHFSQKTKVSIYGTKGNVSATAEPKQEEVLFSPVATPRLRWNRRKNCVNVFPAKEKNPADEEDEEGE